MSDWGLGVARARDILETCGAFLDIAKIATGSSRLYPESILIEKLNLYKEYGVKPYLGGQFQEFVFATRGEKVLREFLSEAKRLGFELSELSENYVALTPEERRRQIELICACGLSVFGEVGSKSDKSDPASLIAQAEEMFAAGAEMVLVEGAELIENGQFQTGLFDALRQGLDLTRVMFELPTTRIGSTLPEIHNIKKLLINKVGPDVNLANLSPDEIIETESLRVGLGVVGPSSRTAPA
jgi:phosphosulfolactate synthase